MTKTPKVEAEIGRVIVQGPLGTSGLPLVDVEAVLTPLPDGRWSVVVIGGRSRGMRNFEEFSFALAWAFMRVRDRAGRALNGRVPRGTSRPAAAPPAPAPKCEACRGTGLTGDDVVCVVCTPAGQR